MELIGLNELKELNQIADFIISNEMKYPLDSDLVLYIFRKMSIEPSIKNKNYGIKLQLSREELLKNVLNLE